ncbi:hypothetical protein D3C85_1604840 [compost metagenome]
MSIIFVLIFLILVNWLREKRHAKSENTMQPNENVLKLESAIIAGGIPPININSKTNDSVLRLGVSMARA